MASQVKFLEAELRTLVKQIDAASLQMDRAKAETNGDIGTIRASCDSDSARVYSAGMEEWISRYDRVIRAVNQLEQDLDTAVARLIAGADDSLQLAQNG
jgi:uncharacterized protein YukE